MENLNAEQVKKDLQKIVDNYSGSWTRFDILSNALALITSQEQRIKELTEDNERLRADTIEEYRQKVNTKMGKHTHLLGKEYVQRILREVKKEMVGDKDV